VIFFVSLMMMRLAVVVGMRMRMRMIGKEGERRRGLG
jgi:hypothetical protein